MSKIFIVGGPGCGKNTIAEHVAKKLGIHHLNYRAVIRSCADNHSEIKDCLINNKNFDPALAYEILDTYCKDKSISDFVLDGYPKSELEAEFLAKHLKNNEGGLTFFIDTPELIAANRLKNRLVCSQCHYTVYDNNPDKILEVKCATCHLPLIARVDDTDDGIKTRLKRFYNEKDGIIRELSRISKLVVIDGGKGMASVISDVIEHIFGRSSEILAERGARIMMESLGLNLADPNYVGTPSRMVKSLKELMKGCDAESVAKIKKDLNTAFPTHYKGMIILEPIKCASLCSHHLLPVDYEIVFGYIPKDTSIGFSKVVKVVNLIAAKPSLQEDFTQEIIETFDKVLSPNGIIVIVRGKHSCMMIRGEKTDNVNITSAVRGVFKDNLESRQEFLTLTHKHV